MTSAVVVGVEVNWFAHNLDANQPPEARSGWKKIDALLAPTKEGHQKEAARKFLRAPGISFGIILHFEVKLSCD